MLVKHRDFVGVAGLFASGAAGSVWRMTSPAVVELSAAQARRIALAAQGFGGGAPKLRARRPFDAAMESLHVLQIDSVNVFSRSHYMPLLSRTGAYDRDRLDAHLWDGGGFTEYWAHEAALIPVADRPLFTPRMANYREHYGKKGRELAPAMARVKERLAAEGPQTAGQLEHEPRGERGTWWDWSETKHAVEYLFAVGEVAVAGRTGFQRVYGLAEQVLPQHALGTSEPEAAKRALLERAARSLGVGTLADLADYHRFKPTTASDAVRSLQDEGVLLPVTVQGWEDSRGRAVPAWMHRDARIPSRLAPDALLTPFDPLVWFRPRAERLFDFHYRIEIYTPQEKRQYGYYCLPLLVGGRMAGRIDLKADRKAGVLLVQAAWQEAGAPKNTPDVAVRLLKQAAAWQGLNEVRVSGAGNLSLPPRFDPEA